jgi:hypothetical protein
VSSVVVSAAVEGLIDEAVCRRLVFECGGSLERVYGGEGVDRLIEKTPAYNQAAKYSPWIVLMDLDHRAPCPPELVSRVLPTPEPLMCLRVAVRQVESWLLADRDRMAPFLGVRPGRIPDDPDSLDNAKQTMVQLAAVSSRSSVREEMVPRPGSGRQTGPAYAGQLIEFVRSQALWRPRVAAEKSDSLRRAISSIEVLIERAASNSTN